MARTNLDRRSFLKAAGGLGALSIAGVGIAGQVPKAQAEETAFPGQQHGQPLEATVDPVTGKLEVNEDVIVRYSACLGCYSSCGNRLKLDRQTGRLISVGGNPYHPSCAYPFLNFDEPLSEAYQAMGFALTWDDLIKEVTEGGRLFADAGEDREVEGFKALHDTVTPLNPDYPDLGPVSNQFVMLGGRGDGRTTIGTRFTNCFGSLNQYGHGST